MSASGHAALRGPRAVAVRDAVGGQGGRAAERTAGQSRHDHSRAVGYPSEARTCRVDVVRELDVVLAQPVDGVVNHGRQQPASALVERQRHGSTSVQSPGFSRNAPVVVERQAAVRYEPGSQS